MATRAERFADGKFTNPPHLKDGYPLPECKDPRARNMLEFVVPILYLEKPVMCFNSQQVLRLLLTCEGI